MRVTTNDYGTWEQHKDGIAYRLISVYKLEQVIEGALVEVSPGMDIARVYGEFSTAYGMPGFVTITKAMIEKWGVTPEEVRKTALINMDNTTEFMLLKDFLRTLIPYDAPLDMDITLVSNKRHFMGAANAFTPKSMEKILEISGGKGIILPSSVDEVIVVPYVDGMDLQNMVDIVHQVNTDVLKDEMFLSENPMIIDENGLSVVKSRAA